ncbi:MAG: hypothetical protein K2W95_22995 [Candidatus Obscuribacterales bacterium]|nr:hypothetical protein [Candidatus Obscuribacterales bacterium]
MSNSNIPAEIRERNPQITEGGFALLNAMRESKNAPKWNHVAGDRLTTADLEALSRYNEALQTNGPCPTAELPDNIVEWVRDRKRVVPGFRNRIVGTDDVRAIWNDIPTMSREDIAVSPELFVPDDADLSELIVYRTAGTTGHSLLVPHSARAAAAYQPLLEAGLSKHGVRLSFSSAGVACFLVCAQARTVTYPTVLSAWNNAGFAKINLRTEEWHSADSANKYFNEFAPAFLTGDPISFAEMLRQNIQSNPSAMVSTAVAMSAALKAKLQAKFNCPVIEWYSLTETGPIGYGCPKGAGYHILPHDIFVESLDREGHPVAAGERGEITVTGGRNPFFPLLRYRTGDWGRLRYNRCMCGSEVPRLEELEGREPVIFRGASAQLVNPVDISSVLREFPIVQHEFVQYKDRSLELILRPIPGSTVDRTDLKDKLAALFGKAVSVAIHIDPSLGDRAAGGKSLPYRSELPLLED